MKQRHDREHCQHPTPFGGRQCLPETGGDPRSGDRGQLSPSEGGLLQDYCNKPRTQRAVDPQVVTKSIISSTALSNGTSTSAKLSTLASTRRHISRGSLTPRAAQMPSF